MENFDAPYLSTSVGDFWRKWHISLTSWFKDYLYIPLGGSRKGKLKKYINKFIVFFVSGLWHGAKFSYIAWGCLNGLYQIVGEIISPLRDKLIHAFKLFEYMDEMNINPETDFQDEGHLNESGSGKLAAFLAEYILDNYNITTKE